MDIGLIGGIIGGVIGFGGGVVGTYFSITNTKGPLERAFMVKASAFVWVAIMVFILLLLILPKPYSYLMWIPYGIFLPWGIAKINKKVSEVRQRENST